VQQSTPAGDDQSVSTRATQDGTAPATGKRIGMAIGIKAEKLELYKELHAGGYSGVRDLLVKYNIRNFSIFLQHFDDGKPYLFAYYEYVGNDYADDMAKLEAEPRNIAWLKLTDSFQIPLHGESSWATMEEIFYNR
jgi:L-rhamnose mutarotase